MKRFFVFAAILLSFGGILSAQNEPIECRYSHMIEHNAGFAFSFVQGQGISKSFLAPATGGGMNLRYSYFFSEKFGAFAQFGFEKSSSSDVYFFGAMNKADGNKYRYRYSYNYNGNGVNFSPILQIGPAFRMGITERIGFRARLGLGYATCESGNFSYERQIRDNSSGSTYFTSRCIDDGEDSGYLMDYYYYSYSTVPVFLATLDAQLNLYLSNWFFFFAEAGINYSPAKLSLQRTQTESKSAYNPSNFVEAVAEYNAKDYWVIDESTQKSWNETKGISPVFHLNIGVGFNIGRRK